jgi:hypothetical protein
MGVHFMENTQLPVTELRKRGQADADRVKACDRGYSCWRYFGQDEQAG